MTDDKTKGTIKAKWQETAPQRLHMVVDSISGNILDQGPSESMNQWHKDQNNGDYNDPYKPNTITFFIELQQRTAFVRVYDKSPTGSQMFGGWVMLKEDIAGLTPEQIRDKFALPFVPRYICDVYLNAGDVVCIGIANNVENWGD